MVKAEKVPKEKGEKNPTKKPRNKTKQIKKTTKKPTHKKSKSSLIKEYLKTIFFFFSEHIFSLN